MTALKGFGDKIESDPYGSAIGIWQYTSQAGATIILNAYDYTKAEVAPAAYDEFLAIPGNISSTMRLTNMSSLAAELEQPAGYRYDSVAHACLELSLTPMQRLLLDIDLQE